MVCFINFTLDYKFIETSQFLNANLFTVCYRDTNECQLTKKKK